MRLESVSPVTARNTPPRTYYGFREPLEGGGVMVEFSSTQDMRRAAARSGASFFAFVQRCAERANIDDLRLLEWKQGVAKDNFIDEFGFLADADKPSLPNWKHIGETAGKPREGRFYFRLQIYLITNGEWEKNADGTFERGIYHDLRRDHEDLCVYARGTTSLFVVWRSNTVVIPYQAIRAALDAPPPAQQDVSAP